MKILSFFQRFGPLLAIALAFIWASVTIATRRAAETPANAAVIRIGHWQLETGVRKAFDDLAKEFSELPQIKAKYPQYSKVIVVQDAIPEGTYGQWISCNMIAGTAPDLIEVGLGLADPIWLSYETRYFTSLTSMANEPNPFNKGTDLEGIPLRLTFDDAMRTGYREELQEYIMVPLSRFTSRVFYNKTLLEKLTGLTEPPRDFRGFMKVCATIKSQKDERGENYMPIVCSGYHAPYWEGALAMPLTYELLFKADFNRDGTLGNDELFAAIKSGRMSFEDPAILARFNMFGEIKQYFQPGFSGLTRDDAVFSFAQQKAVFISTGTWDIMSLKEQAKGEFEVGITGYPVATKDDPEYGKFVYGPVWDPAGQGFPIGLTRFSKHPDIAKDFLLFLASRRGNQKLNETINWIPSVRGVPLPPDLKEFAPVNQGMYASFNPNIGGKSNVVYSQLNSQFWNQSDYTVAKFMAEFDPQYKSKGYEDWQEAQRDWRRAIINSEKFLAGLRGEALLTESNKPDDALWLKYRTYTSNRQVYPGIDHHEQQVTVEKGPLRPVGPYEYLPGALANIRKDIAATRPSGH